MKRYPLLVALTFTLGCSSGNNRGDAGPGTDTTPRADAGPDAGDTGVPPSDAADAADAADAPLPDGGGLPGDAGLPFVSTTTLYPDNMMQNARTVCGAVGDGVHDDTTALQTCIRNGPVFLPDGTYLVSATLAWADAYGMLMGQSRAGTVIKLQDHAAGFQTPGDAGTSDACVLSTQGHPTHPPTYWVSTGFDNHIANLTVNTGNANPNACGIQFHGSNVDSVRDVTIVSPDGGGRTGLDLTQAYAGPTMISGLEVAGFAQGIAAAHTQYGITFEHVYLHGQRTVGIDNVDNVLHIRDLESVNTVPAIQSAGQAFIVLVDSNLYGGAGTADAIVNTAASGSLFLRRVHTTGYAAALSNRGVAVAGVDLAEFVDTTDGRAVTLSGATLHSLNLPVEETPTFRDNDLTRWQDVGPPGPGDATAAIQAALDSGKPTIYLRPGTYFIRDTLHVPASVRRIVGAGSFIKLAATHTFTASALPYKPVFSFEGSSPDPIVYERVMFRGASASGPAYFTVLQQNTSRTLVVRDDDVGGNGSPTDPTHHAIGYLPGTGVGSLFLDDIDGQFHFAHQSVWARQFDTEGTRSNSDPYFCNANDGATLWMLGLKTELAPTVLFTTGGGRSEILGGELYTTSDDPNAAPDAGVGGTPAFVSTDSSVSLTFVEEVYNQANIYPIFVRQTVAGATQDLTTHALPYHRDGAAHRMPLFVGP